MKISKLALIVAFLLLCRMTSTEFESMKADEMTAPAMTFDEAVQDGYFQYSALADSMCGIDQQGTDMWCEIATNGNQHSIILKTDQ